MTTYKTGDKKPSEMFVDALHGGGSHNMTCGWCSREHYCPDSDSLRWDSHDHMEMGKEEDSINGYLLEALEAKKKDPDGVVIHYDVDAVQAKDLNGMAFVLECPCNGLYRYEQFVWLNKDSIRRYLKVRVEQEAEWALEELTLNKLAGI